MDGEQMFECIYRCTKWRNILPIILGTWDLGDTKRSCQLSIWQHSLYLGCFLPSPGNFMANWWLGNSSDTSRLRVKGETDFNLYWGTGGGEVKKRRAKTCQVFFVFLNYVAWEFDFFNSKQQDESSPKQVAGTLCCTVVCNCLSDF